MPAIIAVSALLPPPSQAVQAPTDAESSQSATRSTKKTEDTAHNDPDRDGDGDGAGINTTA
jgi:hypothetical protein